MKKLIVIAIISSACARQKHVYRKRKLNNDARLLLGEGASSVNEWCRTTPVCPQDFPALPIGAGYDSGRLLSVIELIKRDNSDDVEEKSIPYCPAALACTWYSIVRKSLKSAC